MNTIKLSGLRLVGFQTWQDITIGLNDGLNIVNANNGVGKSVILKALKFSLNPLRFSPRDRGDLIRTGCKSSEIYYCFNNDVVFKIVFTTRNVEYYRAEGSLEFTLISDTPPSEMIGYFGSIIKGDIISNIVSMDSSQLLVNSNFKDNSDLLSLLLTNEDLDTVIDLSEERLKQTKYKLKEVNVELNALESQLVSEPDYNIEVKANNLNLSNVILEFLPILMDISDSLESLDNVGNSVYAIETYPSIFSYLEEISSNLSLLDKSDLPNDVEELSNISTNMFSIREMLDSIVHYPESDEVENVLDVVSNLLIVSNNLADLTKSIPVNKLDYLMNLIGGFYDNNYVLSSILSQGDLKAEIEDYEAEKDSLISDGGEIVECPILGKVIYTQGDCIPINN